MPRSDGRATTRRGMRAIDDYWLHYDWASGID
jgi:hypothetical protein